MPHEEKQKINVWIPGSLGSVSIAQEHVRKHTTEYLDSLSHNRTPPDSKIEEKQQISVLVVSGFLSLDNGFVFAVSGGVGLKSVLVYT
jgi:hypothetical protein